MRKFIFLGLVLLLAVGAAVSAGAAWAQGPDTPPSQAPGLMQGVGPGGPPADAPGLMSGFGRGWNKGRGHGPIGRARGHRAELRVIADVLDMTQQDLIAELRTGKTVADVAQEKGVDLAQVVDALIAPQEQRLQRAVERGRLTQEQADAILALKRVQIEDRLNRPFPLDPMMIAAQVLGMEPQELLAELRAGKSVADVAQEKGIDLDEIVNAIIERKVDYLNQLVADGRLTQEQANILIDLETERVTKMLNWHRPPCRCGKGPRG